MQVFDAMIIDTDSSSAIIQILHIEWALAQAFEPACSWPGAGALPEVF
jgi:hypothetical protein